MSAGDTAAATPLTCAQVLDELTFLASVGHSLIVEYLLVHCALGHDLAPADTGEAAQDVAEAAGDASAAARDEMIHLRNLNTALTSADRPPLELARAPSIPGASGAVILLPGLQLDRLVDRELELAKAVDERYARLRPAVAATPALFDGDTLAAVNKALDAPNHSLVAAALKKKLDGISPNVYLRAKRRGPRDDLEAALLDLSDQSYRLVVEIVQIFFNPDQLVNLGHAFDAMTALDKVNRLLVGRGLLPRFTFNK